MGADGIDLSACPIIGFAQNTTQRKSRLHTTKHSIERDGSKEVMVECCVARYLDVAVL